MTPALQAKVLRVLQEGELERVGGHADAQGRRARGRRDQQGPARPRSRPGASARTSTTGSRWCRSRCRRCASAREDIPALVEHFLGRAPARRNGRRRKRLDAGGDDLAHAARLAGQRARAEERRRAARDPLRRPGDRRRRGRRGAARGRARRTRRRTGRARGRASTPSVEEAEREIIAQAALDAHEETCPRRRASCGLERSHLYKKMRALGLPARPRSRREGAEPGLHPEGEGLPRAPLPSPLPARRGEGAPGVPCTPTLAQRFPREGERAGREGVRPR